jgi:tagaturonate reductase
MTPFPETILQFGTGRFLRAFADRFIHEANEQGQNVGRVVIVQSTGDDIARQLNSSAGKYHLVVRGLAAGERIDRVEEVACVNRALAAGSQWNEILDLARSPDLRYIISNTTEAGFNLDAHDRPGSDPPHSFPAKLLAVLRARFEAGQGGLSIIPCELIHHQADVLQAAVLGLAATWRLPTELSDWIHNQCLWLNTLVDRIVVQAPRDHPLAGTDPLLIMAEPFAFWALQERPGAAPFIRHLAITRAADIEPYFLRKVRILNAAHTALVTRAEPRGFNIVREAVVDAEVGAWLERLLVEEIVPTLEGRVEAPQEFARQTLERFRNPYLEHKLADIRQNHDAKVRIRLLPTRDEYLQKFGRRPRLLDELLAANGFNG